MKIFLDDIRSPTDCLSYMHQRIGKDNPIYMQGWLVVRNYDEFVAAIKKHYKEITHISFDHDLAEGHYAPIEFWDDKYNEWFAEQDCKEKTGYECAVFIKEWYEANQQELPIMYVHSMNPVGTQNIINLFK